MVDRNQVSEECAAFVTDELFHLFACTTSSDLTADRPDLPDRAQLFYAGVRHRDCYLATKRQGDGAKAPGGEGGGQAGLDSSPAGRQLHPGGAAEGA